MIVNHEAIGEGGPADFRGGLAIYDVSQPSAPKMITKWQTDGAGVHRYDFDGRYAYVSATKKGYVGNIVVILDLADPAKPTEVSHWWIPGQWKAAAKSIRGRISCDRAATIRCARATDSTSATGTMGCTFSIFRTSAKPKMVAGDRRSPAFPHPTHTCLAIPQPLKGRKRDGGGGRGRGRAAAAAPAFAWIYDITDETMPTPIATINVAGLDTDGASAAADDRLSPAVRAVLGHASSRSPGSRRACASSTSPTRSHRARSAITNLTRHRGATRCHQTTSPWIIAA